MELADVFAAMVAGKQRFTVLDWGMSSATLEEVFISIARSNGAQGGR